MAILAEPGQHVSLNVVRRSECRIGRRNRSRRLRRRRRGIAHEVRRGLSRGGFEIDLDPSLFEVGIAQRGPEFLGRHWIRPGDIDESASCRTRFGRNAGQQQTTGVVKQRRAELAADRNSEVRQVRSDGQCDTSPLVGCVRRFGGLLPHFGTRSSSATAFAPCASASP